MAYPSPVDALADLLSHLKATHLDFTVNTFQHYEAQPTESTNRLDEEPIMEWCDWMDVMLVSFKCVIIIILLTCL